jgi:hypothetical protein
MKRFKILAIVLLLGVAALRFLSEESETPEDWKPLEPTRTIGEDGLERIGFDWDYVAPAAHDPA